MFFIFLRFFVKKEKKNWPQETFSQLWKPNAGYPTGAKPKRKKRKKIHKKIRKRHVTVLQFVPDHRYAIHVWKIVPINHAVVICSDIFSHVYGSCRFHMFINGSCWTVWNDFAFFCRGFYSITATQFMFGIWWPPMFTYLYHSLCVLLFSFMVYFRLCSFIFIFFIFFMSCFFPLLKKPLPI